MNQKMSQYPVERLAFTDLRLKSTNQHLTVILSPVTGPSKAVQDLVVQAYPALARSVNYMMIHSGFFSDHHQPWAVVDFSEGLKKLPTQSCEDSELPHKPLERRWVFQKWVKDLQSQYSCRSLIIYLDQGCGEEDLARAEDLITAFAGPMYTSSKWSEVMLFAADPEQLSQKDTGRDLRFSHNLEFRKWVNENPDSLTSIEIGHRLRQFALEHDCEFLTLEESALRDEQMNLLLAVGQGAKKSPPRLHIVSKNCGKSGEKPLALIGKGITFDSGGINLKPHESFVNCMKNDMGGAGMMAQLFMGLIKSGYKKPLLLAIPSCENAIDANAMKPGVIIKSRSGKTVIVEHTDAEGRLILADAMSYVWDKYSPRLVVTGATLTTASLRQFSNFFTPIHFADQKTKVLIECSGRKFGEAFTFWDDFLPFLQGNHINAAELTNMGRMPSHSSMGGGSNVAAHFLKEFAQGPYIHVDIFNSVWNWSGDYPGAHYGCTGAVFNTLWDVIPLL